IDWLLHVQLPSGELPYSLGNRGRVHYLCYQYNAFQFLAIAAYYGATQDNRAAAILESLAQFLVRGVDAGGRVSYDCHRSAPEVLYYSAAMAAALSRAT